MAAVVVARRLVDTQQHPHAIGLGHRVPASARPRCGWRRRCRCSSGTAASRRAQTRGRAIPARNLHLRSRRCRPPAAALCRSHQGRAATPGPNARPRSAGRCRGSWPSRSDRESPPPLPGAARRLRVISAPATHRRSRRPARPESARSHWLTQPATSVGPTAVRARPWPPHRCHRRRRRRRGSSPVRHPRRMPQ